MLLKYLVLLSLLNPIARYFSRNNACKTFLDYFHPEDNENCFYDPDADLETEVLIEKYAGKVEHYEVTTEDGYILTMYRIPRSRPKDVILLHHSIATHSHIYLWQGNQSLALTLWRHGYDVWLANQRGTTASDRHVNMTKYDYPFWDFSFHEMGLYDVTSELELIREKTNNSKVIFFGHSMGSAVGVIYSSMKATEAEEYLKAMILLAAPCYFQHGTSFIYEFINLAPVVKAFFESLRIGSPLLMLPLIIPISKLVLRFFPVILFTVNVLVWGFCGYTPEETDPTFYNYDGQIYQNNFSWKTLWHFAQLVESNQRFQMYDYGLEKNLKVYGEKIPPLYPIEKISVPTLLVSSYNDSLISIKDSETLFEQLSPKAKTYGHLKISGLNHLDYHLGKHRKELFVNKLMEFLDSISQ